MLGPYRQTPLCKRQSPKASARRQRQRPLIDLVATRTLQRIRENPESRDHILAFLRAFDLGPVEAKVLAAETEAKVLAAQAAAEVLSDMSRLCMLAQNPDCKWR